MKINQGLTLITVSIIGATLANIYDNPVKVLFYMLFGVSLFKFNDYWGK